MQFEKKMVGKVILTATEAMAVIDKYNKNRSLSPMDLLLMEGSVAERMLGVVSPFFRAQAWFDMKLFKHALLESDQQMGKEFWNLLIEREKNFNDAAQIKAV